MNLSTFDNVCGAKQVWYNTLIKVQKGNMMSIAELMKAVEFVVDAGGNKKAVLVGWPVWEELLQQLDALEAQVGSGVETETSEPELSDAWAFDLCGIWDDPRSSEEIIKEIISARTPGREIVL